MNDDTEEIFFRRIDEADRPIWELKGPSTRVMDFDSGYDRYLMIHAEVRKKYVEMKYDPSQQPDYEDDI